VTKVLTTIYLVLLFTRLCLFGAGTQFASGQSASPPAAIPASDNDVAYGIFHIRLAKPLDSERLKQGDKVEAQTIAEFTIRGIKIPAKSRVRGEVTEATSRANGASDSRLAIFFDRIELRGGGDITMRAVIRAIGPNPSSEASLSRSDLPLGSAPTTGAVGRVQTGVPGGSVSQNTPNGAARPGIDPGVVPIVNEETTGVIGIHGLQLEGSGLVVSEGKQVKLVPEMQITLQAAMRITK